ncbi:MAG: hypothetical protein K2J85_00270 [Anaeroplasmataceae bacterium]|nr:hypothetical protein [Anaeroplasmataceae bacterium]
MFLKVFKYDFKAIFFKFIPVFAILPVLAILVRLINLVQMDNLFASLAISTLNSVFWMGCTLFMFYTTIICIMRYVKSLFRDQGYLTHTLPVTKHHLLLSQILADVLMELISLVLLFVCIAIAYFDPQIIAAIIEIIYTLFSVVISAGEFFNLFGGSLFLLFFYGIFSSLQTLLVIYTGIAIGHSFPKNKGLLSVVFCIVLNYGLGFVTGIILIFVGSIANLAIITPNDLITFMNVFLGIALAESILVCVGAYFLNIYLMKYKLNLE